ncbi:MAG: PilZ domain-containing protein [Planctomycetota bacterium]|jgi:hypothetical protein|nr:PilZ domain-containing protein [Planctomycetota bacterium]
MTEQCIEIRDHQIVILDLNPDRLDAALREHETDWLPRATPNATLIVSEIDDPLLPQTLGVIAECCRRAVIAGFRIHVQVTPEQQQAFERAGARDLTFRVVSSPKKSTEKSPSTVLPAVRAQKPEASSPASPNPLTFLKAAASIDDLAPDEKGNITLFLTNMPDLDDRESQILSPLVVSRERSKYFGRQEKEPERRDTMRRNIGDAIVLFRAGPEGKDWRGPVLDLSAKGIQFITDQNLELGDKVQVALDLPSMIEKLTSEGKVIWKRIIEKKGKTFYRIGASFVSPSRSFVEKLLEKIGDSEPQSS